MCIVRWNAHIHRVFSYYFELIYYLFGISTLTHTIPTSNETKYVHTPHTNHTHTHTEIWINLIKLNWNIFVLKNHLIQPYYFYVFFFNSLFYRACPARLIIMWESGQNVNKSDFPSLKTSQFKSRRRTIEEKKKTQSNRTLKINLKLYLNRMWRLNCVV